MLLMLALAVFGGNWLGSRLSMPDHAWKIATVLTTLVAGGLAVTMKDFTLGPDLAGGTTLIYELRDPEQLVTAQDPEGGPEQPDANKVSAQEMSAAIKKRVDPSNQKEVSVRAVGKAIEVIIPKTSGSELELIKSQITDLGQLEFRITADRAWREDDDLIERALAAPEAQKTVLIGDRPAARWVAFSAEEFSGDGRLVTRRTNSGPEALVRLDRYTVTGEYLDLGLTEKGFDSQTGRPKVNFGFNPRGAKLFQRLTSSNLPRPSNPNLRRRLGILLSEVLISAPEIRSAISRSGEISGETMDEAEVDRVVSVLRAGSLPAALNKTPLKEDVVSASIGKLTARQASYAITASLAAVLLFMAAYYRYAGLIACLALAANLLLVLGLMVTMDAAFTLPGMAGLVLTVGMSVDANVLIFERIREELDRGAALRQAIRNGFGRATTTIIDANVTTLIAGVVLWNVGTDAIKGFAVTLILGVLMSMYTAIFCSRVVFDIAERRRWIKRLRFRRVIGKTRVDFINKRWVAAAASLLLIAAGMAGVYSRGSGILNIDFTGGTSVTIALTEDSTFEEVDRRLRETVLRDKDLLIVQQGESQRRYTIKSNLAAKRSTETAVDVPEGEIVAKTKEIIAGAFDGMLLTNEVAVGEARVFGGPAGDGDGDGDGDDDAAMATPRGAAVRLTFNEGEAFDEGDGLSHDELEFRVERALAKRGLNTTPQLENPGYTKGSGQRFKQWTLRLSGVTADEALAVARDLEEDLEGEPIFPLASRIGSAVAEGLQSRALQAVALSLAGIVAYVWFRFQSVAFGLAAVVALVHDVLVTLGAIALSAFVASGAGPVADLLQIDAFQIGLPTLAAFLTIIGYSLNDTIVVFDRVREVRGKSPRLTAEMINTSINQTLSRTLLTSLTTLLVVGILYFAGGPGIHGFAFSLVVGVMVGTYSSIFIASPALLAMAGRGGSGEDSRVGVTTKRPDAAAG